MGVWGWPPPGTTGFERSFAASLFPGARSSRCARAEILRPRAMASATSGGIPRRQATEGDRRRSGALRADDRSGAKGRERPTERSGGAEQRGAGQPRRRREAERRRRRGDGGESPAEPGTKEEDDAQQHKARHAGAARKEERRTNHAAAPPEKKVRPRPRGLKRRCGQGAQPRSGKRRSPGRGEERPAGRERRRPTAQERRAASRAAATTASPQGKGGVRPKRSEGSREQQRHNAAEEQHQPPARSAGERSERQRSERPARRTSEASRPGAVPPLESAPHVFRRSEAEEKQTELMERPKGATGGEVPEGFGEAARGGTAEGCAAKRAISGGHCVGSFAHEKTAGRGRPAVGDVS